MSVRNFCQNRIFLFISIDLARLFECKALQKGAKNDSLTTGDFPFPEQKRDLEKIRSAKSLLSSKSLEQKNILGIF